MPDGGVTRFGTDIPGKTVSKRVDAADTRTATDQQGDAETQRGR